jgi:RNA polymerase sigma-70 factor (ECF subfamily)
MAKQDSTLVIQACIDRLRAGDVSARAALLASSADRLTRLARKMLRNSPAVARWEQTDDVLQNALLRLNRALDSVVPPTAADFFRLAAAQIRRELIDLARHYYGPQGPAAHHSTVGPRDPDASRTGPAFDPSELTRDPARLATWTEFHRQIENLPDSDREMFDLLWYQELTQAEAGQILGLSERQVSRRWLAARLRLSQAIGGQLPT